MPQPLASAIPKITHDRLTIGVRTWDGDRRRSIFHPAPVFGTLAMDVVAEWSLVELDVVAMVSKLCGGPAELAFKIYTGLTGQGAKTGAMLALVESKLRQQDRDIYFALRRFSKVCERARNEIAHHVWGFVHQRADVVLLVDPLYLVAEQPPPLDRIMMWTEADFRRVVEQCAELSECYRTMKKLGRGDDRNRDSRAAWFRARPEIASRIASP